MKKKILTLALVFALSASSAVSAFAANSTSGGTNASTQNREPATNYAASTNNGTTTVTADGASKTSETQEVTIEDVKFVFEDGTVKGAGLDLELQSAVATLNGATYTTVTNKGTINGSTVDLKFMLCTIGGNTAGLMIDPATGTYSKFTGDLTIVLADGTKKLVHVVNGQFYV